MKKIYTFFRRSALLPVLISFSLISTSGFSQPICGPVVENFNNTGGSTAGFTGEFMHGTNGSNGLLIKNRVVASAVYTVTTPTYELPASATSLGFGFFLDGSERIARIEVKVMYTSTFSGEINTIFLGQFVPSYNPGTTNADFCRAVALGDLSGFPPGGRYRFRIELTPNTGGGAVGQTITFDDFRTNGTMSQIPLPVNFIGFEAKKLNNNILLTWKVAGEENVAGYDVERSEDGRSFRTIGSINSHGKDTYTYSDAASSNNIYYRIKSRDRDGKFKYSNISRIAANGLSDIMVRAFPQPVLNQLTVQHPNINGRALLTLSTADGRIVRSIIPGAGSMQTRVDMSSLHKGVYMLRFDSGDGNIQTMKVVKQ